MKRLLLLPFLLIALALSPTQTPKTDLFQSVVTLNSGDGFCSAFSVNEEKGFFLTADHCLDADMSINDHKVDILATNGIVDLALIHADVHDPALLLGDQPPQGSEVELIGYVKKNPVTFSLSILGVTQPFEDAPFMFLFGGPLHAVGGMSGGPIVDAKGGVVSVITGYVDEDANIAGDTLGVFYPAMVTAYKVVDEYVAVVK